MGMGRDYRQWHGGRLGTRRELEAGVADAGALVVHDRCGVFGVCAGDTRCLDGQQAENRTTTIPPVLRIRGDFRSGNHLRVSHANDASALSSLRIWWFVHYGSRNPGDSRRSTNDWRLTRMGENGAIGEHGASADGRVPADGLASADGLAPADGLAAAHGPGKRRVLVLFGGRSAEHDVSCTSAVAVLRSLDPARYDIQPIGVARDGTWVRSLSAEAVVRAIAEGADPATLPRQLVAEGESVVQSAVLPALNQADRAAATLRAASSPEAADASADLLPVVIPILHGPYGEDGTMQGLLELAGVPYVGAGVLGSAVAMDKAVAKDLLHAAGLPQAKWLSRAAWDLDADGAIAALTTEVESSLGWPVFVKPANLGSSVGVSRAVDAEAFRVAVDLALGFDDFIVVEEAIQGREIEFAVLGNEYPEVSTAGEIKPGNDFYDYEDKYVDDAAQLVIPAALSAQDLAEGQALAVRAYKALRCEGMARVDFFFDDKSTGGSGRGWVVNEANTIPGFTPISMYPKLWEASGLSYAQLLDRLIELAVARHARRNGRFGRGR
jgi:D-alanine-D-alanine ligase